MSDKTVALRVIKAGIDGTKLLITTAFPVGKLGEIGLDLGLGILQDSLTEQIKDKPVLKTLADYKKSADDAQKIYTNLAKIVTQEKASLASLQGIVDKIKEAKGNGSPYFAKATDQQIDNIKLTFINEGIKKGTIPLANNIPDFRKIAYFDDVLLPRLETLNANEAKLPNLKNQSEGTKFEYDLRNSILMISNIKDKLLPDLKQKMNEVFTLVNSRLKAPSTNPKQAQANPKDNSGDSLIATSITGLAHTFDGMTGALDKVATAVQGLAGVKVTASSQEKPADQAGAKETINLQDAINEAFKDVTGDIKTLVATLNNYFSTIGNNNHETNPFEGFRDAVNEAFQDVTADFKTLTDSLNSYVATVTAGNDGEKDKAQQFKDAVNEAFQDVTDTFKSLVEPLSNYFSASSTATETTDATEGNGLFQASRDAVNEAFKDVIAGVKDLVDLLKSYLKVDSTGNQTTESGKAGSDSKSGGKKDSDTPAQTEAKFKEDIQKSAQSMLGDIFKDATTGKMKSLGDYLKSFVSGIMQSFNNLLISNFSKQLSGMVSGLGLFKGILGYADGGSITGNGTYIVGERGPEVFVPNTSGTIIPNHRLTVGSAKESTPQVTVNVINNSGQQVSAKQESHFDGQRYVVDVWLDALARNVGGVRDVLYAGGR